MGPSSGMLLRNRSLTSTTAALSGPYAATLYDASTAPFRKPFTTFQIAEVVSAWRSKSLARSTTRFPARSHCTMLREPPPKKPAGLWSVLSTLREMSSISLLSALAGISKKSCSPTRWTLSRPFCVTARGVITVA
jgi:hypothetical protein